MIGHDDENEKVQFKVADKRKFNADGSLREGVTLEAAKSAENAPNPEPATQQSDERPVAAAGERAIEDGPLAFDNVEDDESGIPGAQDPTSFVNFLSTLATNAAAALGAVPHPATGQRSLDLESGKYWLDILSMLREKTVNNLHPQESRLIDGLLADLRMQYVRLVKATEEKLKAQAAQKFSGADLLGKK